MSEMVHLNMLDPDLQRLLKTYAAAPERDPEAARRTRSGFTAELDMLFTSQAAATLPREEVVAPMRSPLPGRRVLSYVLGAMLVLVLFFSSSAGITAYAAGSSLPGDPLYAVKITTENLRARWTPDSAAQAQLYLNFAARRLIEIRALIREGRFDDVDRAMLVFERDMQKFAAVLEELSHTQPAKALTLRREVAVMLRRDGKILGQMLLDVPGEAQSPLRGVIHAVESAAYSLDAGDEDYDRREDGVLGGRGGTTDCMAGSSEKDDDRCSGASQQTGEPIIQTPVPPAGNSEDNADGSNTGDDRRDDDNGDDDDDVNDDDDDDD
jgi:hypothetical protein